MACISAIVLVDGFQHGDEDFFTKALAFGSVRHQTFNLRRFDSTALLLQSPRAIATYRHQSHRHGWEINSTGEYRITGFHPGHAPGRIRTGTSSSRGLNPLGERVTTACLFPGPRGFIGAPARADPCTEPRRQFMSARTSPDSRRAGVKHVKKDRRLSRVDARPPPRLTSRPCPMNSGSWTFPYELFFVDFLINSFLCFSPRTAQLKVGEMLGRI